MTDGPERIGKIIPRVMEKIGDRYYKQNFADGSPFDSRWEASEMESRCASGIVAEVLKKRAEHLEALAAAFVKATGVPIEDASRYQLVEEHRGSRTVWYFELKPNVEKKR